MAKKATEAQIKKLQQIANGLRVVRDITENKFLEVDSSGIHHPMRVKVEAYLEAVPYGELRKYEDKQYYNHMRREYMRLNDAGRAAIAANVSADAAPAWTPKPGMLVRFKQGVQLSGDNRDVDAIQGMGVVGKIIRRCAEVGYEWTVSFGLDGDYNAATDELEPASEPAPDAAQTASVREQLAAIVSPYLSDTAEELYEPDGAVHSIKRDDGTLIDGTWIGGSLYIDAMQVGMEKREQDAQIAALERDLEAARTEAAALREALRPFAEFDPRAYQQGNLDREVYAFNYTALKKGDFLRAVQAYAATAAPGEWKPMVGAKAFHILIGHNGIIERRDNDGTYHFRSSRNNTSYVSSEGDFEPFDPSVEPDADDAAIASARQRADDGTRHSVADVEAALEAQWAETWTPKVGDLVRVNHTGKVYPVALVHPGDLDYFMLDEGAIDEDGDPAGTWQFTSQVTLVEPATPERITKYANLKMPEA